MKSSNNIVLLLCIFFSLPILASEYTLAYDSANAAYLKKDYDRAIRLYETIISANKQAPEIYYNLGNAYYQKSDFAHAILNYERAKKLAPNDEDILANLKFANQKTEDKIEAAPEMFLVELQKKIVLLMNEKSWSLLCIFSLILGLFLLGLFISSRNQGLKKAGFYIGGACIAFFIVTFFIAKCSYTISQNHNEAIITSSSVTVLSSPTESSTKLFILHKGSKVVIREENNGWMEIRIANGNVGWVKAQQVEKI